MTSANEEESKKSLKLSRPGRLELKKTVDAGQVRQSFPHGRSKAVSVEVKRKRTFAPGAGGRMTEVTADALGLSETVPHEDATADERLALHHLTAGERAARLRALEDAQKHEELRKALDAELRRQAEEESLRQAAEEEARRQQEEERARLEADARSQQTEIAPSDGKDAAAEAAAAKPATTAPAKSGKAALKAVEEIAVTEDDDDAPAKAKRPGGKLSPAKPVAAVRRGEPRRRAGKMTIVQALDDTNEERIRSLASVRRAREKEKQRAQALRTEGQKVIRDVVIPETITVQELANRMAERGGDVIKALMKMNVMATINQPLDADT
ncbi:MAG: translation initiation factor IF-2 associated domain-containing protein, partial [Dongiaceae bacterium]